MTPSGCVRIRMSSTCISISSRVLKKLLIFVRDVSRAVRIRTGEAGDFTP